MAEIRCPECGTQVEANDFACSNCQLILNATSATGLYQLTQPSIVRALLSPAEFSQVRKAPKPPKADHIHEKVTVRTTVIMDEYTIPKLTAGLDVALQPLLPFEAQVASYLDGRTSVPEVARLAALSTVETHAVLRSLLQRRVIELHRVDPERAARGTRPAPRDEEPTDPASASGVRRIGGARGGAGRVESEPAVAEPARAEAPPPLKRRTTTSGIPVAATPVPSATPPPVRRRTTTSNVPLTANPPTIPSRPTAPRSTTQNQIPAQPPPKPLGELLADVPTPTQARDALKPLPPAPPPPPPPDDGTVEEQQAADERAAANKSAPLMDPNANVLERAIALERDGDVGKAIDTLKRAISKSKDPAPIYNKLALIVLDQRRDYRQAEELLQQAVDLDPSNPVYRQNLLMVIDLIAEQPPKPPGFFGKLLGRKER